MNFFSLRKSKILILIIVILFILSLNFYQKEVKNFFYLISFPAQKFLWKIGDQISDFFETIFEIRTLKKENEILKLKIQALLSENISLKELKNENVILREALRTGLNKEFKLVLAEVIGKDMDRDSILINKGSRDKLIKGLVVITQQKILIGKITEVYPNFSRVSLISEKDIFFNAKIIDKEISGVARGKGRLKVYLDLIPQTEKIEKGDLVVSAPGKTYPKGLLIGYIGEIKKNDVQPFQKAEILPLFDFKELKTIFVIL